MSLHLTKNGAIIAASQREVAAAKRSRTRGQSSGYKYQRFGYRKAFFVLWEAFEYSPHARPRRDAAT